LPKGAVAVSNYPDWVNAHKEKGTSVKKVGNEYYLYRNTSRRVQGKRNPQPVQEYIGAITRDGVVRTGARRVSTDRVRVYEYGMSYAMQSLLPDAFLTNSHDRETLRLAFLHVVRRASPRSYLLRGVDLPPAADLGISPAMQWKRYERLAGVPIEELRPLSGLYLVETRECDMLSEADDEMRGLFARLGVRFDAVQG
jgi:hypothetical protein